VNILSIKHQSSITHQLKIMKKQFFLALLFAGSLVACTTQTQIQNSWRDPNVTIQNPGVHKIVVAALLYDQGVRRQVEDYMASLYPGKATPSYLISGDSLMTNEDEYSQKLQNEGYDGIVIMKQVNMNISQHYVAGQFPAYYHTWGGYWGNGWGTSYYFPGSPGHFATDRTWIVQVNVYSLPKNALIWSANTKTTDPGGRVPLFEDVCNAIRYQMKSEGFLK
jgi:hypothetical protein